VLGAGPACLIPCVSNVPAVLSLKVKQLEVRCETKTKDNVFVTVEIRCARDAKPPKSSEINF